MDIKKVNEALSAPHVEVDGLTARITGAKRYGPAIKSVGGRWDSRQGVWVVPLLISTFNALKRAGVPVEHPGVPARDLQETVHPNLSKLYPYQRDSVRFLLQSQYPGSLLALSPGLGKSAVAVIAAEILGARKVLTLCPKVLVPTWRAERAKWGTVPWNDPKQDPLPIWQTVNYEYALWHRDEFLDKWDLVIVDESVVAKNRRTERFKYLKELRKHTEHMWLLSGSPVTKYCDDLWTQFNLCFPAGLTSYWRFANEYTVVTDNIWGGKEIVASRPIDMPQEFSDLMFVRNQNEVLEHLPDFIEVNIPVEIQGEQKRRYNRALDDFLVDLEGEEMAITTKLAQLTRLQQLVSHPVNLDSTYDGASAKVEALLEMVDSGALSRPLLIWTNWRGTAPAIVTALRQHGLTSECVIGETPDAEKILQRYRDGNLDALVLSLGVGKYGLTLTATRTVVYIDKTFAANDWVQSLARVRRIGLDHTFHIVNIVCPRTTDDLITDALARKAESIAHASNADLAQMLRAL